MARQAHYIHQLNSKDERIFRVFKDAQHMSKEQALSFVSQNRLENYQKERIIRKIHYIQNGKQMTAYELTHLGRKFIESKYPQFNKFYENTRSVRHNIALAEEIIKRQDCRYLNEREIQDLLYQKIADAGPMRWHYLQMLEHGQISACDGAFISDGGEITCIEITTENYSAAQIESKENCASVLGGTVTFVRK